jgi:hypothetical protein
MEKGLLVSQGPYYNVPTLDQGFEDVTASRQRDDGRVRRLYLITPEMAAEMAGAARKRGKVSSVIEDEAESLKSFVKTASSEVINDIIVRMKSSVKIAEVELWRKKLQDYINTSPPKYQPHLETRTPVEFLEDVWGEYMDHEVLYQDNLSAYDRKLIPAIYNYWSGHARKDRERVPPPKRDRTDAIIRRIESQGAESIEEVARAIHARERRTERSHSVDQED